ncbi:AMP-binding protein [Mesobacillus maritimus]|uniref:AMP-binding protein n=1 Tax=Mesobacillus maritimus TaxID=1643336 RepID=UPI00203D706F|nr:AMP-binding protein [Mesobacillus maritimus]MCM3584486.1 AMP-binding protein [Mesobacillus maritimus]
MSRISSKSWPSDISLELKYRLGAKPLHEYLKTNAEEIPTKVAYSFYGNDLNWKELDDYVDRFAGFLVNQGVKKGDCVALFLQNCPQYIIAHYAIQRLGAVVVPLNPMYKDAELRYLLNEATVKGVVSGQELYDELHSATAHTQSVEFIVTTNYADFLPKNPTLPLPEELKLEKRLLAESIDFTSILREYVPFTGQVDIDLYHDIGLMVFTSGTTGRPKAAMLPYISALFKTAATVQANQVEITDTSLAVAPLCHIAGMVMGVNTPVYSGCTSILLTRFDPAIAIEAIETYSVSVWYSIAPMNAAILNTPGVEKRNLSSLRRNMATSFGIPVTQNLAEQWKQLTNGCLMYEAAYGLSETHTCDTFMPSSKIKWGSCGIPTFETEIKILDTESGKEVEPCEKGEIVLRNPGVFKGYLNRPEATAETIRDGWIYTGDIGSLDEDGYLYFHGRLKEMIKCSGYSVFPEDVEALLNEHPAIQQSAAIGIPDALRGESVKAFVVLKPNYKGKVSEVELIAWAKEHMAAYKYPRTIEFINQLPATSSGKVLRRLLKEPQ